VKLVSYIKPVGAAGSFSRSLISMLGLLSYFLAAVPCLLLMSGLLSVPACRKQDRFFSRWLPGIFLLFLIANLLALPLVWRQPPGDILFLDLPWGSGPGIYLDSLTATLLLLISWIGWIIVRYSVGYLQGETDRGNFLRWLAFTLAAVSLMVLARNLIMLAVAWMLCSWGLHRLLLHYPERSWGVWAARKKFLISRLGDVLLLSGIGMVWNEFGSFAYQDLFESVANRLAASEGGQTSPNPSSLTWIGILFALGGMAKSAQFPCHSWLPDTMETPTPVSALMHAGVINAGGFLIIRLSPIICLSSPALNLLVIGGGFTALFASVVFLTQTSVKRALAWSTIAQMGFMMLQCGLGAFAAATLHILAHSIYKAHAFLISGSVIDSVPGVRAKVGTEPKPSRGFHSLWLLLISGLLALAMLGLNGWLITVAGFGSKSLLFGLILALAFCQLLAGSIRFGSVKLCLISGVIGLLICATYWAAHFSIDLWLNKVAIGHRSDWTGWSAFWMLNVAGGFVGVFALQLLAHYGSHWTWIRQIHVHAVNGFYLDIPARRLTAWLYGLHSASP
jgi:NAD(P)H-quinone oxidoreductase subunit 5